MGEAKQSGRPRQSWLASEDSEKFASAVMLCQSLAPWNCWDRGSCINGGDCFTTDREAAATAWRMIARLHSDNAVVQAHLDRAVAFLRYDGAPLPAGEAK